MNLLYLPRISASLFLFYYSATRIMEKMRISRNHDTTLRIFSSLEAPKWWGRSFLSRCASRVAITIHKYNLLFSFSDMKSKISTSYMLTFTEQGWAKMKSRGVFGRHGLGSKCMGSLNVPYWQQLLLSPKNRTY